MTGWLVQVKTANGDDEQVAEYLVVTSNWMKASDIARQAELAETGDVRIINTRVLRQASRVEMEGVPEGQARQRRSRRRTELS